jgi:transposase-like protein
MEKILPSNRIRKDVADILEEGVRGNGSVVSALIQKASELVIQELLEEEVTNYLQRGYYERSKGSTRGHRNGYEPARVKTAEGKLTVQVPQVRNTEEPYRSKIAQFLRGNTEVVERLAAEMYARGLSTRDIEDALRDATGDLILSKSAASRISDVLWEDYEAFRSRDLSRLEVEYVFVDAVYERARAQAKGREAILCAWATVRGGRKVLLHLAVGYKESYPDWLEFFRHMIKRGLRPPISITSDGAPGLIRVIEEVFPKSLRVRCWFHLMKNLASKVEEELWPELKAEIVAIRDAVDLETGRRLSQEFMAKHERTYPALVECLSSDLEAALAQLRVPVRHRKHVRTTNLIERSFEEERRRTKVIPGFLTERACLKLVFSVLIRASRRWRRVQFSERDIQKLDVLRMELGLEEPQKSEATAMETADVHSA